MLREEGLDWLEEENRFLRAKLQELERNPPGPAPRRHEVPGIWPGRTEGAVAEGGASGRSTRCHDCARTAETLTSLRESERRLRAIFEANPDGIILIDDQMRLVEANRGAEKIFGVPCRDLIGRPIADLFDTRFDRELTWACSVDAGEYSGEESIHRPDGRICEVEVFGRANLEPGRHLFYLHEVTEPKRMGGALMPGFPFCDSREALV